MRILLYITLLFTLCGTSHANLLQQVPQSQLATLQKGHTVTEQVAVHGVPWPKLILFRVVHAPPHVVSNLFKDYTAGPSYMPGVLAAKVLSRHGNTAIVEYTVKAPIIGQVSYTVQNTLTQHGNQTKVAWKLVHSTLAKSSDGSLNMEPYGNNQTLICYTNLCVPIVSFVPGLQAEALKTAQVTVNALAKESQRRAHAAH